MPVLENALRGAIANAIDDAVNTGAGNAQFVLETAADVAVASFDLQNPAFGPAAVGVITLAGAPIQDTNAAGGTISQASLYDRDANKLLESVAATSGQEVTVSSLTVAAGETVTLTSLNITVPTGP